MSSAPKAQLLPQPDSRLDTQPDSKVSEGRFDTGGNWAEEGVCVAGCALAPSMLLLGKEGQSEPPALRFGLQERRGHGWGEGLWSPANIGSEDSPAGQPGSVWAEGHSGSLGSQAGRRAGQNRAGHLRAKPPLCTENPLQPPKDWVVLLTYPKQPFLCKLCYARGKRRMPERLPGPRPLLGRGQGRER